MNSCLQESLIGYLKKRVVDELTGQSLEGTYSFNSLDCCHMTSKQNNNVCTTAHAASDHLNVVGFARPQ